MSERPNRVTLRQVAARAGVSTMTASYTYNQPKRVSAEARARVLAAAAELGYAGPDPSARSLRRGSSRTVGVVLGEALTYAFEDPQAASFLAGVASVCVAAGYGMTILPITGAADDGKRIHETPADGFIVWTTSDDDPVLAAVAASRRPAVVHGGPARDGLALVGIDNAAAARAIGAVAYAGARRPAVLSFPLGRDRAARIVRGPATTAGKVPFPVTRDRLRGYRAAARAAGHPWSGIPVAVCPRNSAEDAERAAAALLGGDPERRPDAIVAMSDQQAAGVLRAAATLGIPVPDRLAVTGWDDDRIATELGLTTVAQSLRDQGATCADIVLGRRPATGDLSAPWTIVHRTSTSRR
ncbi:MAG: LacI family DNA-binding transcriptional regulator [Mycobacteriales bacterium]